MKLHGLHKGRAPDVILVPPQQQPRKVGGKSQAAEKKSRKAVASAVQPVLNDKRRRNVKTVVSRTKQSMSLTRFEKLPKTTVSGTSSGVCDPMSGATVAFISKVFKVDPVKLKEEIKKKEEELQKGKGREKDIEFDPNTKLIYDYLKTC